MKLAALFLIVAMAVWCACPTAPEDRPLEGAYEIVDFYRTGGYTHQLSMFRLMIHDTNATGIGTYTINNLALIEPFNGRWHVVSDTLYITGSGKTWIDELKFGRWRDGLLIGRWAEGRSVVEVTLLLEK